MLVLDAMGRERLRDFPPLAKPLHLCEGGQSRAESVQAGLTALLTGRCVQPTDYVLIHDAVRPNIRVEEIDRLLGQGLPHPVGAVLAVPVSDTIKWANEEGSIARSLPRQPLWSAQTPQLFRCQPLIDALEHALQSQPSSSITDEAMAMELAGLNPLLVQSVETNYKVTTPADLQRFEWDVQMRAATSCVLSDCATDLAPSMTFQPGPYPEFRLGQGFDVHAFAPGNHVMLGGVRIDHPAGLRAHSDGDVVLHALCDALLGALALGDIGQHFPPSDARWANVAGMELLARCMGWVGKQGWTIQNVDITVICERPKISTHAQAMRSLIAPQLCVPISAISIKATTTEQLGFTGREEGIAAQATALLIKRPVFSPVSRVKEGSLLGQSQPQRRDRN